MTAFFEDIKADYGKRGSEAEFLATLKKKALASLGVKA